MESTETPEKKPVTTIGPTIVIRGKLKSQEDLVVKGRVDAEISSSKALHIEQTGIVKANVQAESLLISGILVGNVEADARTEIATQGRVVGDILSPKLVISKGAAFRGKIDMQSFDEALPTSERKFVKNSLPPSPSEITNGAVVSPEGASENGVSEAHAVSSEGGGGEASSLTSEYDGAAIAEGATETDSASAEATSVAQLEDPPMRTDPPAETPAEDMEASTWGAGDAANTLEEDTTSGTAAVTGEKSWSDSDDGDFSSPFRLGRKDKRKKGRLF